MNKASAHFNDREVLGVPEGMMPRHHASVRLLRAVGSPSAALRAVHPPRRVPPHPSRGSGFLTSIVHLILVMLLLLVMSGHASAQWHRWHLGAGAGSLTYNGDLSDKFVNMHLQEPGYHFFAERKLRQSIYLRLESVNGHLRGTDRAKSGWLNRGIDNPNYFRSLNFRTSFHDLSLSGVFYLNLGTQKEKMPRLAPYARAGIGIGIFDVYGDLIYNGTGDKYYYWGDGFIRDRAPNDPDVANAQIIKRDGEFETNLRRLEVEKSYSRFKWQVPVAFGLQFRLSEKSSLNLEVQYTYNMTDYIDNVGDLPARADISDIFTLYAADPANFILNRPRNLGKKNNLNDSYLYLSAGLSFHLGSTAPPRFKAPIFYPGMALTPTATENLDAIIGSGSADQPASDSIDILLAQSLLEEMARLTDSIQRAVTRHVLDSLIRNDLSLYAKMLPSGDILPDNLQPDSVTLVRDASNSNRWVMQYHASTTPATDTSASDTILQPSVISQIYRTDTLQLDSLVSKAMATATALMPQRIDPASALSDSLLAAARVISSSWLIPTMADKPSETLATEPSTERASPLSLRAIPAAPPSPLVIKDTILLKERVVERVASTDSNLNRRMLEMQQSLTALQKSQSLQAQPNLLARIDSLNRVYPTKSYPTSNIPIQATFAIQPSKKQKKREEKQAKQTDKLLKQQKSVVAASQPLTYTSQKKASSTPAVAVPVVKQQTADDTTSSRKVQELQSLDTLIPETTVDTLAAKDTHPKGKSASATSEEATPSSYIRLLEGQIQHLQATQESLLKMMNTLLEKMVAPPATAAVPEVQTLAKPDKEAAIQLLLSQPSVKVFFGVGQSALGASYHGSLDKMARQIRDYPELRLELRGFADPTGNAAANLKLSEKRAAAVRDYLVQKQGINPDRIVMLPSGQEDGSKDLSFSRRVEVRFIR